MDYYTIQHNIILEKIIEFVEAWALRRREPWPSRLRRQAGATGSDKDPSWGFGFTGCVYSVRAVGALLP